MARLRTLGNGAVCASVVTSLYKRANEKES